MEKYLYHYTVFGQTSDPNAYGGGSYNAEVYGDSTTTQTGTTEPGTGTGTGSTTPLADTGFDIVLPLALGITMIAGSVIALVKMHRGKKASTQK